MCVCVDYCFHTDWGNHFHFVFHECPNTLHNLTITKNVVIPTNAYLCVCVCVCVCCVSAYVSVKNFSRYFLGFLSY